MVIIISQRGMEPVGIAAEIAQGLESDGTPAAARQPAR